VLVFGAVHQLQLELRRRAVLVPEATGAPREGLASVPSP
jgi:hypothetical protein